MESNNPATLPRGQTCVQEKHNSHHEGVVCFVVIISRAAANCVTIRSSSHGKKHKFYNGKAVSLVAGRCKTTHLTLLSVLTYMYLAVSRKIVLLELNNF